MKKTIREGLKVVIVVLLAVLTFNAVYDLNMSYSKKDEDVKVEVFDDTAKVKKIAAEEAEKESAPSQSVQELRTTVNDKTVKYVSLVAVIIIAVGMLMVLSKKEDLE